MNNPVLSETERVQQQTNEEWLTECEGNDIKNKPTPPQIIGLQSKAVTNNQNPFLKRLNDAGIVSVRYVGDNLLISTDRSLSPELDNRIKRAIPRLAEIAEEDTGETLYEYLQYRTLFSNRKPYLALVFKEIHTGTITERYFNIKLQNKKGKNFKTGINGEFRIAGSIKRPMKGSFIKFWIDTVTEIPYGKPSHIYRHMNSKLTSVVISCPDPEPHHGGTKLHTWKYEGRLYKVT